MKSLILLFVLLSFTQASYGYPIFFSCRADKSLSTVLTPKELAQQLTKLAMAKKGSGGNSAIAEACQGLDQCITDFQRLVELAKKSSGVARDQLVNQIKQKAEKTYSAMKVSGFLPVSAGSMAAAEKFNQVETQIYSCQEAKSELQPSMLASGGKCTLGNFHHSPYMFVTGVRDAGIPDGEHQIVGPPLCDHIDSMINGAVAMGQDPYAELSISLMENGTEVGALYLDPIGEVTALGCPAQAVPASVGRTYAKLQSQQLEDCAKTCETAQAYGPCFTSCYTKVKANASGPYNLESFSTYYKVKFGVVNDPQLAKKLSSLASLQHGTTSGTGYICSNHTESTLDSPKNDACCLQVPFKSKDLGKALVHSSFKKYVSAPLPAQFEGGDAAERPARRLQRFNGYSHLMGGAEGVPAWRSGVDYYKTPAYGLQAMDFYLNSVATNPYIAAKVHAAEQKLGVHSPSALCLDVPPGSYAVEHDYYFKKHANAKRMGSIQASWAASHSLDSLTKSQQNVLRGEINEIRVSDRTQKILAAQASVPVTEIEKNIAHGLNQQSYEFYMTKILPHRDTIAKASFQDQGYSWNEMTPQQFDGVLKKAQNPEYGGRDDEGMSGSHGGDDDEPHDTPTPPPNN